MKEYLLSVVAVCLLIVLLEIFMSEGNTKKYVQGIVRLILIIVLLTPIIRLSSINIAENEFAIKIEQEQQRTTYVDETFVSTVVDRKINTQIDLIERLLNDNNVYADVEILRDENKNLTLVKVIIKDYCINDTSENIFDNKKITKLITDILSIDENKVKIYDET